MFGPRTNDPVSPCKKVSKPSGNGQVFVGCGRTLHEIAGWSNFSTPRKIQVIDDVARLKRKMAPSWSE
ncbi:DUF1289 domain-containing protein [Erythrobacter sp.]|uniref:DUF1289 domain-containing protein n=1 Tax=Erythrobacter sp. TaxID=1042 RepID=UPI003440FB2D